MNIEYDENKTCASFYFKGSCSPTNNYNIYIKSKYSSGNANVYDIYVSGSGKAIQGEYNTGNTNYALIKTNLTSITQNGLLKNTNLSLPLSMFDNNYYDGTNVVIPAGKSISISLPTLKRLNTIAITTTGSASFGFDVFGMSLDTWTRIGGSNATDTNNVTTVTLNSPCDILKITNKKSGSSTISDITITGFFKK